MCWLSKPGCVNGYTDAIEPVGGLLYITSIQNIMLTNRLVFKLFKISILFTILLGPIVIIRHWQQHKPGINLHAAEKPKDSDQDAVKQDSTTKKMIQFEPVYNCSSKRPKPLKNFVVLASSTPEFTEGDHLTAQWYKSYPFYLPITTLGKICIFFFFSYNFRNLFH